MSPPLMPPVVATQAIASRSQQSRVYTGRRIESETAGGGAAEMSGLYYYRARMYSPTLGRFIQPDPIGYRHSGTRRSTLC